MCAKTVLPLIVALASTGSVIASTWVVPRAAEITGANGAHYTTDLKILNRGSDPANVSLQFLPSGGSGATAPAAIIQSVASGQTLVLASVLNSRWNLSETFGGIQISSDHVLLIEARTYNNANPQSTFGYQTQAALSTSLPDTGQQRHAIWVSQSADPTVGFSTLAGALLLTADAVVQLKLYDSSNNQIGISTLSGSVGAYETPLASLVQSDLSIGRIEFDVTTGMAAPYAIVFDNVTGDPMNVPALQATSDATDVVLPSLVKATAAQDRTWRSDLRLISPANSTVIVQATVNSSSVPALIGITQSITLDPGGIVEIQDALGSLFSVPDGAVATIELKSPSSFLALARTAFLYQDGTPGSFGYLQSGHSTTGFLVPGQNATLIGLKQYSAAPGSSSTIGAAAGPDGFTADLTLSDSLGNVLVTVPSGVNVLPLVTMEVPIGTLLPNVTIPDDSHLDIVTQAGEAMVYSKNADLGSNDVDQSVASILEPYYCPAPSGVSFYALPPFLTAAGSAQLRWYAGGATSVQIDQNVGGGGESGSATVQLAQSTTFNLNAQNDCGTTSTSLTVPIGLPTLSSIAPANPMPGETAAVSIANVTSVSNVSGAQLICGSAVSPQLIPLNVDASSNVTFTVPYVVDSTFPGGYWNGSCQLTVLADSGTSAPYKFTIAPLVFTGDPINALTTLVSNLQQDAHAAFAAQAGDDVFGPIAASLDPLIDQWAGQLNQMASDIRANGTATFAMDVPTDSVPNPPTATVSSDDLMHLMAYLNSSTPGMLVPDLRRPARVPHSRLAPAGIIAVPAGYNDDGSAACLIREPQIGAAYAQCLAVRQGSTDPVKVALNQVAWTAVSGCSIQGGNLANALARLANTPVILCEYAPVTWNGFTASQTPPQTGIPLGPADSSGNKGTRIMVNLKKNAQGIGAATLGAVLAGAVGRDLNSITSNCGIATQAQIQSLYASLASSVAAAVGPAIAQASAVYPNTLTKPVYKCDLKSVVPLDPAALAPRHDLESDTVPPLYFDGLKRGTTTLQVTGFAQNFIASGAAYNYLGVIAGKSPYSDPVSQADIDVEANRKLLIGSAEASTYGVNASIPQPINFSPSVAIDYHGYQLGSGGASLVVGPSPGLVDTFPGAIQNWNEFLGASASKGTASKTIVDLIAINPAEFGKKSFVSVDAKFNLAGGGNNFADGTIMVTDSNGATVANVRVVGTQILDNNDNPISSPFPLMVDSSGKSGVDIYAGLTANAPFGGQTPQYTITLTINFINQ